jgi:hypothetical protein
LADRRALELLAASRDGCTEAMMLAHSITIEQMVELVRAGLVTATSERVVAGGRKVEVARVQITEAVASGHSSGAVARAAPGYEATREEAMAAFAKSWRRE